MLTATPQHIQFQDENHEQQVRRSAKQEFSRQKTDGFCFILFIVTQVLIILIALFIFHCENSPQILAKPYDPSHHACGVGDLVQFPYIYFTTPMEKFLYRTVCVSECPKQKAKILNCYPNEIVDSCKISPSVNDLGKSVLIYDTIEDNNICLPTTMYYYTTLKEYLFPGFEQQAAKDTYNSRQTLLLCIGLSFLLSLGFLFIIERAPTITIWLFLILILAISLVASIVTFKVYYKLSNPTQLPQSQTSQISSDILKQQTASQNSSTLTYLWIGCGLLIISLILLVVIFFQRKRIQLTIMMVKVTADFIRSNQIILMMPVILFFILYSYFLIWLQIGLYIVANFPMTNETNARPFEQVQITPFYATILIIHCFGLFWFCSIMIGIAEFITSGAVVDWYYYQAAGRGEGDVTPVLEASKRLWSYHMGSVALGSILIASTSWISVIIEAISRLINTNTQKLCFKYFTKYSYVIINKNSQAFFQSSKGAISIVDKYQEIFYLVGGLGESLIMMGRIFISLICSYFCYISCIQNHLVMSYVPSLICFFMSFTISSLFMSVYGISAETINLIYHASINEDGEDEPQRTSTFQIFLTNAQNL